MPSKSIYFFNADVTNITTMYIIGDENQFLDCNGSSSWKTSRRWCNASNVRNKDMFLYVISLFAHISGCPWIHTKTTSVHIWTKIVNLFGKAAWVFYLNTLQYFPCLAKNHQQQECTLFFSYDFLKHELPKGMTSVYFLCLFLFNAQGSIIA